jgi:hypothetical protein
MHFRVRKNVIQLVRTTYNDSKKKGDTTIVGSVRLAKPELSDELRGLLTAEEIQAFEYWLLTQHRTEVLQEELAALTLMDTMQQATKWFEREGDSQLAHTTASNVLSSWQALRKVLIKNQLLD